MSSFHAFLWVLAASLPLMAAAASPAKTTAAQPFLVLAPQSFQPLVRAFAASDDETVKTDIPNQQAFAWLSANAPRFDCPDQQLTRTWWFRWWSYRKHLKKTPDGWLVTEFLPDVPWAGKGNSISCAAGHHLYEGRWLRDPRYMDGYARFWLGGGGEARRYSFWAADSIRAVTLATGNKTLVADLLPALVANYEAWEKTHQDTNGLFQQSDDRDGMEYSLGGSGYRPTMNSYQYGDAVAIAAIAQGQGQIALARTYREKAATLKGLVQTYLWDKDAQFFETAPAVLKTADIKTAGVREQIGFVPWYFDLPNLGYESAWNQILDPQGFAAPYGPTTAERRDPRFLRREPHDCLWNGPSWPYATTQTLVAMANLLNDYQQTVVTKRDYMHLLLTYARSQQRDGKPWVAEDLDPLTGKWVVDLPRSIYYNHSGFADPIITGLVGLRPRADERVIVNPLVTAGIWNWFCLDGLPYHGHSLSVLWDKTGTHYGKGTGLRLFCDGRLLAHQPALTRLEAVLPAAPKLPDAREDDMTHWTKYALNPVLGGDLGTCFDLGVLRDQDKYRMWFSWRPQKSIALSESQDGFTWSKPTVALGPAPTGWEDDLNRPAVVKRSDGYHLWYTGQANGRSEIGYAASPDGVHWTRLPRPVLQPDQPWEKVAVMCPDVLWDEQERQYRMWYSGGEQYEPDAIGYATSTDGIRWTKRRLPVFVADSKAEWERYKVTAGQVVRTGGWFYLFYVGFRDVDHAQIGIARSRDGITGWERSVGNPIVRPTPGGWDADACYKPFALYDGARWLLWYNGRHGSVEQIGVVTKDGFDLGF